MEDRIEKLELPARRDVGIEARSAEDGFSQVLSSARGPAARHCAGPSFALRICRAFVKNEPVDAPQADCARDFPPDWVAPVEHLEHVLAGKAVLSRPS